MVTRELGSINRAWCNGAKAVMQYLCDHAFQAYDGTILFMCDTAYGFLALHSPILSDLAIGDSLIVRSRFCDVFRASEASELVDLVRYPSLVKKTGVYDFIYPVRGMIEISLETGNEEGALDVVIECLCRFYSKILWLQDPTTESSENELERIRVYVKHICEVEYERVVTEGLDG